jgi:hypothetical protein
MITGTVQSLMNLWHVPMGQRIWGVIALWKMQSVSPAITESYLLPIKPRYVMNSGLVVRIALAKRSASLCAESIGPGIGNAAICASLASGVSL